MSIKSIFMAGLLSLFANSVLAATVEYSDFSSWSDDVSGLITTETYNGYDFTGGGLNYVDYGTSTTLGGITYTLETYGQIFGVNKNLNYDAAYHKSNYLEWQNAGSASTLTITFASYTNAIGFNFGQLYGDVQPFTVTLGNGDSFTLTGNTAYAFFGAVSTTAFNTLKITGQPYPALDNLSVGPAVAAPVPEPESYGMLLAGLLLTAFVVRRSRQ
ncbi:PEP-CTERM sorting domain-containing protein [Methylophilus sp. 5]|uniref:PEP-CTERM sorting domain-containing protein n=1 Tax=Methylophilus sp. 5 TaxID=1112274 RepID=UPI0004B98457|nr:PEP-CTERM sorting domain-containing protein [Methylophilus sp. 5]